jgi:hypothetical protein
MGSSDNSKVIPLFQNAARNSGSGEQFELGAMREVSLARRRGLDTVEAAMLAPARPAEALTLPALTARPVPENAANALTSSRLSAMFIESLDDMIRRVPSGAQAAEWPNRSSATLEKVAIDIVDMLFGIVLGEPLVPGKIKDALMRAQLPMLQLAMRDTAFFSDWQHPARQMLSEIAPMIRAYIDRGGEVARFEQAFVAGLDRVLDQQPPNRAACATLHDTLAALAYDAPTRDITDDSQAWDRAQVAARHFLERPLPHLVRSFLTDFWIDVLQRTALANGPESPHWHDAVSAIEELAWSLTPKETQDDRLRLIGLIPALLARLNRGLDLIDVPRDERRPFFDELIEVHAVVLRVELAPPAAPVRHESAIERVMRLQRGDWVELTLADGSVSRERLTWISPQRGILVFSNHQGQRAIQISPEDLADLVAQRKAQLIFDHAEAASGKHSA